MFNNVFMKKFDSDYNSEKSLKRIAELIRIWSMITAVLVLIAGIIVGCFLFGDDDMIPIGIVVIFGSVPVAFCSAIPGLIWAHKLWGFGEIVGNTKRMSGQNGITTTDNDTLPEL